MIERFYTYKVKHFANFKITLEFNEVGFFLSIFCKKPQMKFWLDI